MAEKIDISPKLDGGVLKQISVEGTGDEKPQTGSTVEVHYVGTLTDGTQFDSSRDRNQPFSFVLGKGSVIKAWDIGVATMKLGERAILTCASEYGYGSSGSPPTIPPDSTLVFDVEVLGWTGEDLSPDKDGSILRTQIISGEGYTVPNEGSSVDVQLQGTYEGRIFDDREVSFDVGEGEDVGVIEGVDKALEKFNRGEKSRLKIAAKYAFGSEGSTAYGIPPNATVEYIVTLKSFSKPKECWALESGERLEQSTLFKEKGTSYFKDSKLRLAVKMYKKVLSYLEDEGAEGPLLEDIKKLRLSAHLNLSLCYLKSHEYFDARNSANLAIELDPCNEKAFFRRGLAFLALEEPELADKDFGKVLELEPNNQAAKKQKSICARQLKIQLEKEKKIYANMFEKFAKTDTQKEEDEKRKEPDVMSSLGEWGKEDRHREPSEFEKENPNILLLNGSDEFKDM